MICVTIVRIHGDVEILLVANKFRLLETMNVQDSDGAKEITFGNRNEEVNYVCSY